MSDEKKIEPLTEREVAVLREVYADVRDPTTQVMVVPRLLATLDAAVQRGARLATALAEESAARLADRARLEARAGLYASALKAIEKHPAAQVEWLQSHDVAVLAQGEGPGQGYGPYSKQVARSALVLADSAPAVQPAAADGSQDASS